MTRYVHNKTNAAKTYSGQEVAANSYYEIPSNLLFDFSTDDTLLSDIASGDSAISKDGSTDISGVSAQIDYLKNGVQEPRDPANRQVVRFAATIDGWHYQLLTTEITTAKKDGFYCKDEDGNDVGFITHKIYDSNGAEITDAQNEGQAVETRFWIRPTHHYEVIGAIFGQNSVPTSDIRLWVTGLPGIYNVRFARGGINLKHAGSNMYQLADGRASKYLAYNAQAADANSFKFTLKHTQGTQHTFQVSLEIYKAP